MYYRGVLAFLTARIPVLAANSKGRIEYGSNVLIDSKDIADLEAKVGSDAIEVKDDDGKAIADLTKGLNQLNNNLMVSDGSGTMTIGDMIKALYDKEIGGVGELKTLSGSLSFSTDSEYKDFSFDALQDTYIIFTGTGSATSSHVNWAFSITEDENDYESIESVANGLDGYNACIAKIWKAKKTQTYHFRIKFCGHGSTTNHSYKFCYTTP